MESASKEYNGEINEPLNTYVALLIGDIAYSSEEVTNNWFYDSDNDSISSLQICPITLLSVLSKYFSLAVPKVKHQLREKEIGSLVTKAFEKFRTNDAGFLIKTAMENFLDYM